LIPPHVKKSKVEAGEDLLPLFDLRRAVDTPSETLTLTPQLE